MSLRRWSTLCSDACLPPAAGGCASVPIGAHRLTLPSGIDVALTSLEFVFLKTLAEGQGQPVSRKRIVAAFGDDYLTYDQRRLDSMVRRLRQKVMHETSVVLPVNTYHGVGYGFTAELTIEP